jgi:hypothetical protein
MIFGLILSTKYTKIRIPRIIMNSQNVIRDYRLSLITFIKNTLVVAYKGNNKITELRTILQMESQNS